MNKKDLIKRLSEMSNVGVTDCEKVLDAFGKVLESELEPTQGLSSAFNKFCTLIINVFKIKIRII